MRQYLGVCLALAVLSAGCQTPTAPRTATPDGQPGPTATTAASSTPTPAPTPTDTETRTPTPTPTATPYPNPWGEPTVTVAVDAAAASDNRSIVPLVRTAITYWNTHGRYRDYPVEFVLRPNASFPDLVVRVKEEVLCDLEGNAVGCAVGVYNRSDVVSAEPAWITVERGYDDESTVRILKHEFGHIVGRTHGERPMPTMNATIETDTLPRRDAVNRSWPWRSRSFAVYVDRESITVNGNNRYRLDEIEAAVRFYESNRDDGWLEDVDISFVSNRSEADIVINASESPNCETDSCGDLFGDDLDGDGRLEWFTLARITLATDLDVSEWSWHVAWWLAWSFGASNESDWPDDLKSGSPDGPWWEE